MSTLIKDKLSDFKNAYPELQFMYDVYDSEYKQPSQFMAERIYKQKPENILYHFSNQFLRALNFRKELPDQGAFVFCTKWTYDNDDDGNLPEFANILYNGQSFFKNLDVLFFEHGRVSYCKLYCGPLKKAIKDHRKKVRDEVKDIVFRNTYEKGLLDLILN